MRRGRTALLAIPLLLCFLAPGVGAQDHRLGAVIDAQLDARVPYKSSLVRGLYTLPPRASVKQYAPYAGDQGDHGTCTAWSSAYAATTIIYAKLNGITDRQKITQLAFSPGFAFRESFGSQFPGCAGGQAIPNVLRAIQDNGVPLLSELDSLCPATLPRQAVDDARPYSILGFTRLLVPGDTASGALQKIKKSLSEGKPVVVGMYVDWVDGQGCFHNAPPDYVWKPVRTVTPQAGHAMTIVSYDDAYAGGA
ncbi:MAG TPA: C1 family peptidase, partial [Spirochaetia bacterium]|nr:C1 family peptidase [Spirochaetia bacterium]